jgi:hypothetical protein
VLKLEVRNGNSLHFLITLKHQFVDLLQHLTLLCNTLQQLNMPFVRLADTGLLSGLSFHSLS